MERASYIVKPFLMDRVAEIYYSLDDFEKPRRAESRAREGIYMACFDENPTLDIEDESD